MNLEKYGGRVGTGFIWLRIWTSALVNMVMNLQVPLNVGKFLSSLVMGSFSRRTWLHGVGSLVGWLVGWLVMKALKNFPQTFRNW
jgi:hypothetical protein